MKEKIEYTLNELPRLAARLKDQLEKCRIITFSGVLGAGKTTFIKELLKQLGVSDTVVSPTFTYVNCYQNEAGKRFYHFDLYRVENADQFCRLGFDEYLDDVHALCLIEWPRVIQELLPTNSCSIELRHGTEDKRELFIKI